jgi:hypothetical protein
VLQEALVGFGKQGMAVRVEDGDGRVVQAR